MNLFIINFRYIKQTFIIFVIYNTCRNTNLVLKFGSTDYIPSNITNKLKYKYKRERERVKAQ